MARLGRAQPSPPSLGRRGAWPTVSVAEGLDLTVIQRSGTTGSLTLSGTHDGATSVQVKIINAVGGATVVDWTTVDAAPGVTTWAGTLTGIPQGGWYVRQVRPGNATANVTTGSIRFGVGVLLPPMGQSIHVQWFTVGTDVSPHAMLVQYSGGTWSARGSTGNGANAFGNAICTALGGTVPVALLPLAVGSTALNSAGGGSGYWMNTAGGSPYALALAAINAVGGKVEAIPWDQGQQDGFSNAVSEATYASDLATFIARWRTALSQSSLPFIIAPLGRYTNAGPTDASWQGIINAQTTVGGQTDNVPAASMQDLALVDGVHYTNADYIKHGQRMARATLFAMGLSTYAKGPTLTAAVQQSSTVVRLTIAYPTGGGTDFTPTTGITGVDLLGNGSLATLSSAVRVDATHIDLTASAPLANPVTVRSLYGTQPTVTSYPHDNTSDALPLQGFKETAVSASATASGQTLTATASLIAGAATGQVNATASGQTLTATTSLNAGTATGQSNATASGQTLAATASLIAGSASAANAGTANGATVNATTTMIAGAASGQANATAAGVTVTAVASLIAGSATAANGGTAAGATVQASTSLIPGSATGTAAGTAAGATLAAAASLIAGAASGAAATIYRPTSDVSAVGWTATPPGPLYDAIDETSANDADFITSPPLSSATPASFGIGPLAAGSYRIRVRASTNFGVGILRVKLLDISGTTLATSSDQTITDVPTTYEPEVTIASGVATRVQIEVAA